MSKRRNARKEVTTKEKLGETERTREKQRPNRGRRKKMLYITRRT